MSHAPDWKPSPRVRDPELLKRLHLRWRECALADETCVLGLSLHHVLKHPRDDVIGNLVMLCGSGTTGHHSLVEAHHRPTLEALSALLRRERPDTMDHLAWRLGSPERANERLLRGL